MQKIHSFLKQIVPLCDVWLICLLVTIVLGGLSIIVFGGQIVHELHTLNKGYFFIFVIAINFISIFGSITVASKPSIASTISTIWIILIILTTGAALTVASYAFIYESNGIDQAFDISFKKAQYFSIVTFTTLGYGDIQPRKELQLLAASEALIGYIYLGLIVGLLGGVISKPTDNH